MNQAILNRPRNDKFLLVLDIPEILKDKEDFALQEFNKADLFQFSVFGSPVPEISVPSVTLPYGGQSMNVSSHSRPKYPPLTLNYLVDNGYKNYWLLWKWLNALNDSEESYSEVDTPMIDSSTEDQNIYFSNLFSKCVTDFTLFALDEYNNKIISFKYSGAFITSLGTINYSHQENEEIIGKVTFAYNQLLVELLGNIDKNICQT